MILISQLFINIQSKTLATSMTFDIDTIIGGEGEGETNFLD